MSRDDINLILRLLILCALIVIAFELNLIRNEMPQLTYPVKVEIDSP